MRFTYPAHLQRTGVDEIVVSFRDLPECLTSGADETEALAEAADALEEAIAGRTNGPEPIPEPSTCQPGEYLVSVPADTAVKAAAGSSTSRDRNDPCCAGHAPWHRRKGRAPDARSAPPQFREPHPRGRAGARSGPGARDPRCVRLINRCRGVRGLGIAAISRARATTFAGTFEGCDAAMRGSVIAMRTVPGLLAGHAHRRSRRRRAFWGTLGSDEDGTSQLWRRRARARSKGIRTRVHSAASG